MTNATPSPFNRLDYIFKLFIVIALSIAAAILASDIIVPLAFAGLISVVMLPLVRKLERRGLNSTFAISLVLTLTIILLLLFFWLVINQVVSLVNDLPNIQAKFINYINRLSLTLMDEFGISTTDQATMLAEIARTVSGYMGSILVKTTNTISILVQIPIYIFLFLIYRDKFKAFVLELIPTHKEKLLRNDIERVLQGYISGLFLVTMIIAFLNTIGLMIVGIDHAIFFGILSGVLTIIPYVGIIIGSLFPILMALITKDSMWYAIGVVIVFSIVQFLEGNFITPKITGSKVSINALAAIIALLIGGKILGIAGMILSIPAIGIVKLLLSYSPRLKPFVILLEDIPDKPEIIDTVPLSEGDPEEDKTTDIKSSQQ